jgi:bifunctional UDP-N-acetylglucosamine pyrophosphorylase / glucosamine-1-phosphate N-acetyltransferase
MTNDRAQPKLTAIILAAGQGTRMKSAKPKVLHELCGRPMIHFVVEAALTAGAKDVIVVVGHGREEVSAYLAREFGAKVRTAVQETQQGTGHAARCALPQLASDADQVFLLSGDTPLLDPAELQKLPGATEGSPLAMLTVKLADPTGYGRILRDDAGRIVGVREQKDASLRERAIDECNPAISFASMAFLRDAASSTTSVR